MSLNAPLRREYRLHEINFDEYQKERIDKSFAVFYQVFSKYNIDLGVDIRPEVLRSISKVGLQEIAALSTEVKYLDGHFPKIRYAYEFHSLNILLKNVVDLISYCNDSYTRVNTELQKTFAREKELSVVIPYSEFKNSSDLILHGFSTKDYNEVDYDVIFFQILLNHLIIKGNIEVRKTPNLLDALKNVDSKIVTWAVERAFSRSIYNKFKISIPQGKSYWKCLLNKTDDLGKKMGIESAELILFEAALSELTSSNYSNGKPFYYPDSEGQKYIATSNYIVTSYPMVMELKPYNIELKLSISVSMLKAKSAFTIQ
jgi:hypothetical protein